MKPAQEQIEVNLEELEALLERARQEPLDEAGYRKLEALLEAFRYLTELIGDKDTTIRRLRALLVKPSTEKTSKVLEQAGLDTGSAASPKPSPPPPPAASEKAKAGHGRNGAQAYRGARRIRIAHASLKPGDHCPECWKGKVYLRKEPALRIRLVGQAPLAATVYELESLRCNLCGEVFEAPVPEGVGENKYDESAAALIGPAFEELTRQAAQGEVFYNDDTSMKILALARASPGRAEEEESSSARERTGLFTSGIVSTRQGQRVALFFTGRKHAGENFARVLAHRAQGLPPPIQMCDALSRNLPKLPQKLEIIVGHCNAHARRHFVEVTPNFPEPCRFVLESLGEVYGYEAQAEQLGLSPDQRLRFHQQHSAPVMEELYAWLKVQFTEKKVEPNSGLGTAIAYVLRHWDRLTLFLRQAGAPLDSNLVERALKKAILHRKNSLFYKTANGAEVGDLFMSLIHTCELCGANPFDYLTELQRHAQELQAGPAEWMPWNYRETLARAGVGGT